jgi:hypothetical protein
MKARVIATGEIVEVKSKVITSLFTGKSLLKYVDQKTGISYFEEELFFPKDLADDPDYWTHLEHQYAGMAMQGIVSSYEAMREISKERDIPQYVANMAFRLAHALVEKLKEKEERK